MQFPKTSSYKRKQELVRQIIEAYQKKRVDMLQTALNILIQKSNEGIGGCVQFGGHDFEYVQKIMKYENLENSPILYLVPETALKYSLKNL